METVLFPLANGIRWYRLMNMDFVHFFLVVVILYDSTLKRIYSSIRVMFGFSLIFGKESYQKIFVVVAHQAMNKNSLNALFSVSFLLLLSKSYARCWKFTFPQVQTNMNDQKKWVCVLWNYKFKLHFVIWCKLNVFSKIKMIDVNFFFVHVNVNLYISLCTVKNRTLLFKCWQH